MTNMQKLHGITWAILNFEDVERDEDNRMDVVVVMHDGTLLYHHEDDWAIIRRDQVARDMDAVRITAEVVARGGELVLGPVEFELPEGHTSQMDMATTAVRSLEKLIPNPHDPDYRIVEALSGARHDAENPVRWLDDPDNTATLPAWTSVLPVT